MKDEAIQKKNVHPELRESKGGNHLYSTIIAKQDSMYKFREMRFQMQENISMKAML